MCSTMRYPVHSKFDCDMCAFVARTEEVLESHKSECHFILDSEIKLQDHKSKKHEANKYHCDYCGFAASTLAQLDLHIGSYHNIKKNLPKIIRRDLEDLMHWMKSGRMVLVEILMTVHVDSSTHVKLCMFQERCRSPDSCRFFHTNHSNIAFLENLMIQYSKLPNPECFPCGECGKVKFKFSYKKIYQKRETEIFETK